MASGIRFARDGRLGVVTLDASDGELNTLGTAALGDFAALLDLLAGERDLEGLVLISAKKGNFLAGADLKELERLDTAERVSGWVRQGQELLEGWAALPVPTVAAIRGVALGGGLEVALACTWRVAVDEPATRLGLPEVRLGLVPALGGTYRLPRRVGLRKGVEMLLTGRQLTARQALEAGLVDELAGAEELPAAAKRMVARGPRRDPVRWGDLLLAGNPLGRRFFFSRARAAAERRAGGHYPAPGAILRAVETGYARGRRRALAVEAEGMGRLAVGPVSRNLVRLFLATRELAGAAAGGPALERLGIVGAGFMGSGIAAAAARAGLRVRMTDTSPEALESGLAFCRESFATLRRRGSLGPEAAAEALARIEAAPGLEGFERADLVVEAVVEDPEVKRALFSELEPLLADSAVLGSNTSTIPITRLAAGLRHPGRMLGIHFFSPVHKMPLVELIRHPETSDEAVGAALALARALGKTPIVVRDGPGFYTSRILSPYLAQGARMLLEGAPIDRVDAAGRAAGFPVGPLALLDEVGLDVAAHAARTLADAFGDRMPYPQEFRRMVEAGRLGRKSGKGFYDYSSRPKRPDPKALELLGWRPAAALAGREMSDRLLLAMAAEAVRCLEEGILDAPRDGDVGAVLGLGFPPFLGGPFRYLDALGADRALALLEELAGRHGPVFAPPQLLRQRSLRGDGFHS